MLTSRNHKVICDGKFSTDDGGSVICEEELHPDTRAIPNKAGVMGHHCSFCHDPHASTVAASALGLSQVGLRDKFKDLPAAQRSVADRAEATAKKAVPDTGETNAAPASDATSDATDEAPATPKRNGRNKPPADDWPK